MTTELVALALVVIATVLLPALRFLRRKAPLLLRDIPAFSHLRRAAGMSVEEGTRLHLVLGQGDLLSPRGAASFAALALLRRIGERSSIGDRPLIASAGDATLTLLAQDTLQTAYQVAGEEERFRPEQSRLSGLTPFSYAAGTMSTISQEQVSTNILIGDFGAEAGLLADAAERTNTTLIAAAMEPAAQSVLFASTVEPLVGEELFAAPAYLSQDASQQAGLQTQDLLRWILILTMLLLAGLKAVGGL